jgi:hypothetical protein
MVDPSTDGDAIYVIQEFSGIGLNLFERIYRHSQSSIAFVSQYLTTTGKCFDLLKVVE